MSTEIKLEYPYNTIWSKGYLNINQEGRKTLYLYNSHKDRTTTQYARYLISVHLKRFLNSKEQVDHIDENKANNDISNLQVLSVSENLRKANKKPDINLICPVCKIEFSRSLTQLRGRQNKIVGNTITCSRKCGGKYSHKHQKG